VENTVSTAFLLLREPLQSRSQATTLPAGFIILPLSKCAALLLLLLLLLLFFECSSSIPLHLYFCLFTSFELMCFLSPMLGIIMIFAVFFANARTLRSHF
jgi:hypothetical protein